MVAVLEDSRVATNSWLTDSNLWSLLVAGDMVFFRDVQAVEDIEAAAAVGWGKFVLGIRLVLVGGSHWELVQSNPAVAAVVLVVAFPCPKLAMISRTWSASYQLERVFERSSSDCDLVERHRILTKTRRHCVDLG